MALSIRSQIYAVCLGLFLAVSVLLYRASLATYAEQTSYAAEEAARAARLIADRTEGAATTSEQQAIVATALAAMPAGASVWFTAADDRVLAGSPPPETADVLIGEAPARVADARARVALPRSLVQDRTWRIYRRNFVSAIFATTAGLLMAFVLSHRWRRGLRLLEQHARRVGAGDRTPPPPSVMPSSEMTAVQHALTEMEQNLSHLERQVVRQERLAAIGVLASGLAHEMNNPLQAIAGRAQLVLRDPAITGDARTDLELIRKESERASIIIRNLSRFSRQGPVAPEPVRLGDVVASALELRQRRLAEIGIHLEVDDASAGTCLGVFAELQQVVLNFIVNAEQAMASIKRGQRLLTIRTRDLAGRVYCEVEDTGPGIAAEDEQKLFQPFFTTKAVGEGTGLGLSVSYGIIDASGGRIGHRPSDSGGAIFWFEMPAT